MHELALTQSILDISLSEAKRHGAKRIDAISIRAGALSSAIPALVQEYFDIISRDTIAEGALLNIERVPATASCRNCGVTSEIDVRRAYCPVCKSHDITLKSGTEFYVDSIDVT